MDKFSFVLIRRSADGFQKIRPMKASNWPDARLEASQNGGQPARLAQIIDRHEFSAEWVVYETRVEIELPEVGQLDVVLHIDQNDMPRALYNVEDRSNPATGHAMAIPAGARFLRQVNDALRDAGAETLRLFVSSLCGKAVGAEYAPVAVLLDPANDASAHAAVVLHSERYGDVTVEYASMRAVFIAAVEAGLLKGGAS